MADQTYRVIVRGKFDRPDAETRERMLAEVDGPVAFTDEGALSYNAHLAAFSFRMTVRVPAGESADREARDHAELAAMDLLDGRVYPYRDLTSTATCMDDIKVRRR